MFLRFVQFVAQLTGEQVVDLDTSVSEAGCKVLIAWVKFYTCNRLLRVL